MCDMPCDIYESQYQQILMEDEIKAKTFFIGEFNGRKYFMSSLEGKTLILVMGNEKNVPDNILAEQE